MQYPSLNLLVLLLGIGIGYFYYSNWDNSEVDRYRYPGVVANIARQQVEVLSARFFPPATTTATATITTTTSVEATTKSDEPSTLSPTTKVELNRDPITMLRRSILKSFLAVEKSEGAGARVRRSIGVPQLRNFTPFLMLDHFTIGPGAGFPDHPHRGQETITYLLSGSVDHEDFTGSRGTIRSGDLQFMTAGRGIVHAEMPGKPDPAHPGAPNVGMQLWVDLPQELKYCEPRYRDLRAEEIPHVKCSEGKVDIKIISGESQGVESVKDLAYTPVWLLDIAIAPGGRIAQPLPKGWNSFMYILSGSVHVHQTSSAEDSGTKVPEFHNVVFNREGEGVDLAVPGTSRESARVILVAGKVLEQNVVQYGPFVVESQEAVYRAMRDYQGYTGGFERAKGWRSEIGKAMG
ncbi:RmlC-like cupin domain-containing protein [Tirmania nivea]|nr:RmlC-like cupin domain-containing protein [Tirmania nivea]